MLSKIESKSDPYQIFIAKVHPLCYTMFVITQCEGRSDGYSKNYKRTTRKHRDVA